jgi:hypothetical protein
MLVLRILRLQWSDLAKAVLFSTLIMAMEWKQVAVIIGLMQMLGVSLLVLIDPKARRTPAKIDTKEVQTVQIEVKEVKEGEEVKTEPAVVVESSAKDVTIAIPGGKIFMAALSIPALIVFLGGGVNEDTVQMAILVSMGLSIFLGLLALVLSLLKEVRTSAIAGATGALLFYASYFYLFLIEGMQR